MDNKTLILLLLLLKNNKTIELQSTTEQLKGYISSLEVDPSYTLEKIHIAENILPYIPEDLSDSYNQAITISKGVVKTYELKNSMANQTKLRSQNIHFDNNMERLTKIVSVIQNDSSNKDIKNLGIVMDLIVNMDKYKNMYSILNTFLNNKDSPNGIEDIFSTIAPLLKGNSSKEKEASSTENKDDKSMEKMLNIVKLLSSKDEDKDKNKANER